MPHRKIKIVVIVSLFIMSISHPIENLLYRVAGGVVQAVVVSKNLDCIDGVHSYGHANIKVEFDLFSSHYNFEFLYNIHSPSSYCKVNLGDQIPVSYVVLNLAGNYFTSFRLGEPADFLGVDIVMSIFLFLVCGVVFTFYYFQENPPA